MVEVDGSFGEGGGQILRTALALSLVTRKPFRIGNIRAGRKKPGLMRQHLTAVIAAAEVGRATVQGNAPGSRELSFTPKAVKPGRYHFAVGTAGSCTLVLQTVLPALLTAEGESELGLEGGTHNPFAPPFDFLAKAFLPLIGRMGPRVAARLERPGFYPAGGGRINVLIKPTKTLSQLSLLHRGRIKKQSARAVVAQLPRSIGEREVRVIREKLSWDSDAVCVEQVMDSRGPGNVLMVEIESEQVTEVFAGFGRRGLPAEHLAERTVREVQGYLAADVPVGKHLADQLLIPIALVGGGTFRTLSLTRHTETNIQVLRQFLDIEIVASQLRSDVWEIAVRGTGPG